MLSHQLSRLVCAIALCSAVACAEDPSTVASNGDPPGFGQDAGSAPVVCSAGGSESCSCPGTTNIGTRSCLNGQWLTCTCLPSIIPDPGVNAGGECLGGRYEGSFKGTYRSGFALGLPINVEALNLTGDPGLAFTLEQTTDTSLEFPTFSVKDGFVDGVANGAFPFKGALTGTLDCKTKKFTGTLDGGYSILFPLGINEGKFVGPIVGDYDAINHKFTFGTWTLEEKDAIAEILGETGGEGTWEATRVGAAAADAGP